MNDEWPFPPPFMWACDTCTELLQQFPSAIATAEADPFYDGAVRLQFALSRHVVSAHPGEVPAPHPDCEWCKDYQRRGGGDSAQVWAEHRTRDLFLPAAMARLL